MHSRTSRISVQKPFGVTVVPLASLAISAFLTNFCATMTVELLLRKTSTGRKLSIRQDILWRGFLLVTRRLDAATDCEVANIMLMKVRIHSESCCHNEVVHGTAICSW